MSDMLENTIEKGFQQEWMTRNIHRQYQAKTESLVLDLLWNQSIPTGPALTLFG